VVVKGDVGSFGNGKSLKKDIDPSFAVEIVVLEKIDNCFRFEFEGNDMIQEMEKRSGLCPLFDLDNGKFGLIKDEMSFAGMESVEEECNVDPFRVKSGKEIFVAFLAGKPPEPFFVVTDVRKIAVSDKKFDFGCFPEH
jgi:hypothetical protein